MGSLLSSPAYSDFGLSQENSQAQSFQGNKRLGLQK